MLPADLAARGERIFTICNACRYCEAYCPLFPALERGKTLAEGDLTFLSNLCHNCGECLYACQYAPPHEFGVNVPRTTAEIRLASYEGCAWPSAMATAFRRANLLTAFAASAVASAAIWLLLAPSTGATNAAGGDFYAVMPHRVMVVLFGGTSLFVLAALVVGLGRFLRAIGQRLSAPATYDSIARGWKHALTLSYLHTDGVDCADGDEVRVPWRRWCHHLTFYGLALCLVSTSVAAFYHTMLGWRAPYAYSSLPVLLGTTGGLGLILGPAGLLAIRRRRDRALMDPAQDGMDVSFVALLLLTSATGLTLLAVRESAAMRAALIVHLGSVMALFVALPYGKFVHGIYRVAALVRDAAERSAGQVAKARNARNARNTR
jgi:citrate/tricarballylate utilization protein